MCSPSPESCQPAAPSQHRGTGTSLRQVPAPAPLVFVGLPGSVSTQEAMTGEMMNCKYPASAPCSLAQAQANPLEMFLLDWDLLARGRQGGAPQRCQGSCAGSAPGTAPRRFGGDVLREVPSDQPHRRGSGERGWRRTANREETAGGFLWGLRDLTARSPGVPRPGGFRDGAGGRFYDPSITFHPCILQRDFEKFLGTKSYTWVLYLYEMMNINRWNGSNAQNAYQTHK